MKSKLIQKLIAASAITGTIFSVIPGKALADSFANKQWVMQNNNWYCYSGGQLQKGWINYNGRWYYADSNGAMQTGVIQINGKVYCFADDGAMQTNNVIVNGKVYQIGSDGAFVGNDIPLPKKAFDWNTAGDNVIHPTNVAEPSKNTNVNDPYVAYDPVAPKETFQVTFKDEDGDTLKIKNVKDDNFIELYTPTKKGYEFVEWNTKKNGNGDSYDAGDDIKITENMTLYAIWEEIEVTDENAEKLGVTRVEEISISSEENIKEITTEGGTITFTAEVYPVNADNRKVEWSVEAETGKASISKSGVLTAEGDGTVVVKATAKDGSGVSDTMRITISGQTPAQDDGTGGNGSDTEIPEITGDDVLINNNTTESLLTGNTYGTIRISTDDAHDKTLTNITANKLVVNGGGKITLKGCKINYLEVLKPDSNCEIILEDGSVVKVASINKSVVLNGSGYEKVNVNTADVVTINGSINELNISELESKIKINGSVTTLNVNEDADQSIIQGSGSIGTLNNKGDNVKVNVGSLGQVNGNEVNGSGQSGLVDELADLQKYTEKVEKAEKDKAKDVSALLSEIRTMKTKYENGSYMAQWENLEFRLNQLVISNNEQEKLRQAKNYVYALEQVVSYDPTSAVEIDVELPSTGNTVVVSPHGTGGTKYTAEAISSDAQVKVKELTPGLTEKSSLQNRIDSANVIINQGKILRDMINNVNDAPTKADIFNVENYDTIGISSMVSDEYLAIVNAYVAQLSKDDKFVKPVPTAIPQEQLKKIPDTLKADKDKISNKAAEGIKYQNARISMENKLAEADLYISTQNLETSNGSYDYNTLSTLISKLNSVKTLRSQIEVNMEEKTYSVGSGSITVGSAEGFIEDSLLTINRVTYSSLLVRYDKDCEILKARTREYLAKQINSLYTTTVVDTSTGDFKYDFETTVPKLKVTKTNDDIKAVSDIVARMKGTAAVTDSIQFKDFFTEEELQKYTSAINTANSQRQEIETALESLSERIKIGGLAARRSNNVYTVSTSVQASNSSYVVDSDGNVTLKNSNVAPSFSVNNTTTPYYAYFTPTIGVDDTSGYVLSQTALDNLEIADITPEIESVGSLSGTPGKIEFKNAQREYTITLENNDINVQHTLKVAITGEVSGSTYVVNMKVTLIN